MLQLRMAVLVAALTCSAPAMAQPVRKSDDKGAPPFKVLKEGENANLPLRGTWRQKRHR